MAGTVALSLTLNGANAKELKELAGELAYQHSIYMNFAYGCRDLIGGLSFFQAGRNSLFDSMQLVGLPRDEALIQSSEMAEQVVSADKDITDTTAVTAENRTHVMGVCFERMNEASHQIDVLRAKIRKSITSMNFENAPRQPEADH